MRNNSIAKKAAASILIALAVSISLSSSVSLSQQFDETKSAVAYCSQPLKIKIGSIYDNRYFVYASKAGSGNMNINFDKGYAIVLENLYSNSKAQLDGNKIAVSESTAFILHNLEGGELKLSGYAIQFAPSEKCDELVAAMTAINGYSKQKLVDDENLVGAQMELVTAMVGAMSYLKFQDVYGDITITPAKITTNSFKYDANTILAFLEENKLDNKGIKNQFTDLVSKNLEDKEIQNKYPSIEELSNSMARDRIEVSYELKWLSEIRNQLTSEQYGLLERFAESKIDKTKALTVEENKKVLDILLKEKIYKHASRSGLLNYADYLNEEFKNLGLKFVVEDKMLTAEEVQDIINSRNRQRLLQTEGANPYDIFIPDDRKVPHLQIIKKSTNMAVKDSTFLVDMYGSAGGMTYAEGKIVTLDTGIGDSVPSLYRLILKQVHETGHLILNGLDNVKNFHIDDGTGLIDPEAPNEALMEHFANRMVENSGNEGFKFSNLRWKNNLLRTKDINIKLSYFEDVKFYDFIYKQPGGPELMDEMIRGDKMLTDIVDVKGFHIAVAGGKKLVTVADALRGRIEMLKSIEDLQSKIKNNIVTPEGGFTEDMSKIDALIEDAKNIENTIKSHPNRVDDEWKFLDNAAKAQERGLGIYKSAPADGRANAFSSFDMSMKKLIGTESNRINVEAAKYIEIFGGIEQKSVPEKVYNNIKTAAEALKEKTAKIKSLTSNVISEKSLQSLNSAENSILKNKVPEELTKTAEVAKKSANGQMAATAGITMVLVLGPHFREYGEENNNPYLVYTGTAVEYSGLGLLLAQAGATVSTVVNVFLAEGLYAAFWSGMESLTMLIFSEGAIIGLFVMFLVENIWCVLVNIFECMYIQPTLALSKTKAFKGEKITYEISGFDVKNGIGNQEGKHYILTYQGSLGLQLGSGCTVSGGKCKGEFTVPAMNSDTMKIFAQDIGNTYKSAAVNFEKLKSQLTVGATVVTDKSYLCVYNKEWKGETELETACAKV